MVEKGFIVGEEKRKENIMIPYSIVGVIFAIILQTFGAIWWASGVSVKLDFMQKAQIELSTLIYESGKNRYSSLDAQRDWANNDRRITKIETDLALLRDKIIGYQVKNKTEY